MGAPLAHTQAALAAAFGRAYRCAGALLLQLLALLVPRSRRPLRSWRSQRQRLREAATAELRARALMGELCPFGWRAQITVGEATEHQSSAGPTGKPTGVVLEWTEFEDATGRPARSRRVSAPTIAQALDAMVADRRTDETLEQIERGAVADGAPWGDL